MKKIYLFSILIFVAQCIIAQSISRNAIVSAGYDVTLQDGISVSWSIGETFVTTLSGGDVILTQGFQQPSDEIDADGDGVISTEDCDDNNMDVFPGAIELCDQLDNDCNGLVDDGLSLDLVFEDADADGFGNPDMFIETCDVPQGYVYESSDCNDADATINAAADEICDELDNNCDGQINEEIGDLYFYDADGDGFGNADAVINSCFGEVGYVLNADDCDDASGNVFPGGEEICGNTIDEDCDGADLICPILGCTDAAALNYNPDANTDDGSCIAVVLGCTDVAAYNYNAEANTDDGSCIAVVLGCTDLTAYNYNPDANTDDGSCVPVVNGCTDPSACYYNELANTDDGSCEYPSVELCGNGIDEDCDGEDLWCDVEGCIYPDACNWDPAANVDNGTCIFPQIEICDGLDNDCDGQVDDEIGDLYFADADGDGFGNADAFISSCFGEVGYVTNANDCDDASGSVFPGGEEICGNTIDEDCEGGDLICPIFGCTDAASLNYDPDANTDDGTCIPFVFGCTDVTAINFNLLANTDDGSCIYIINGCMDAVACNYDPSVNTDDGSCVFPVAYYNDNDGDGLGTGAPIVDCVQPANTVTNNTDCDDSNPLVGAAGVEISNGADDDCDGNVDENNTSANGSVLIPGLTYCNDVLISAMGCDGLTSIDYHGVNYNVVEIGGQCWFAENLATELYNDGTAISDDLTSGIAAYSYYNGDISNAEIHGALYNWHAVDADNICPVGWHVANDCEWMHLESTIGIPVAELTIAGAGHGGGIGGSLKSTSTFDAPNSFAANAYGFNITASGVRNFSGFYEMGQYGSYWSNHCADANGDYAWYRNFWYNDGLIYRDPAPVGYALSVRCVKNGSPTPVLGCTDCSAFNYNMSAQSDDGSCVPVVNGCTDPSACNYNELANTEDGSCEYPGVEFCGNGIDEDCDGQDLLCEVEGCINPEACNFDPLATVDNGSCVLPGTEICDGVDNNCDGQIDEGLASNDVPFVSAVTQIYPSCTTGNLFPANLNNGADSPVIEGEGNDLWYKFTAQRNSFRASISAATGDNSLMLFVDLGGCLALIQEENEATTGNQILLSDELEVGMDYYLAIHKNGGESNNSAKLCMNHFDGSTCDHSYSINNTGVYANVCRSFKAQFRANVSNYVFNVLSASENGSDLGITPWSYTTPTSSAIITRLGTLLPANLGSNPKVYTLSVGVIYAMFDAANNLTPINANPVQTCTAQLNQEAPVVLRSSDRCPTFKAINSSIATDRQICGASAFEWEFTETSPTPGAPQIVLGGPNTNVLFLSNVPGMANGKTYNVRVRPLFQNAAPGDFGALHCLKTTGAGMVMEESNDEVLASLSNGSQWVNVYPNPSSTGEMLLQWSQTLESEVKVKMYNSLGELVFKQEFFQEGSNSMPIHLNSASSGMYLMEVELNGKSETLRVMINR